MKRLTILLILSILSLKIISAGGVGITPVYYKEFFEPGLEKEYTFHSFNTDKTRGVSLYVKGDLAKYVNLSTNYIQGSGDFVVKIKLPEKIEKPGVHKISIGAIEATEKLSGSNIGGIAAIQGRIDILVPYPGKYSESKFKISNINQGEESPYEIEIYNLGTDPLKVQSKIEIFSPNTTEPLLTEKIPETSMKPKETYRVTGALDTKDFLPGDYDALATISWGEKQTLHNQTLRIGEFLVEIMDYDYKFYKGKINPFTIKVQNKWNAKIPEVFASVSISDNGKVLKEFKTVSTTTSPWETKNITGYFDTTGLEAKRYTARIVLSYGGESSSKLVAIYIENPPTKTYKNYIIAAILAILLIISIFIYLVWKIRKLEKGEVKNGKKK